MRTPADFSLEEMREEMVVTWYEFYNKINLKNLWKIFK